MDIHAQHRDMVENAADEIAIIGAGPAGLFAAEIIAQAGHPVSVYERMPSPARKFLRAGVGGLNLTNGEALETFLLRYSDDRLRAAVTNFPPEQLISWADGLKAETFVGTSGRVFPKAMKASPLLRAWLERLTKAGVNIKVRHSWTGFGTNGSLTFKSSAGDFTVAPRATLFALGGASWPRLGADGSWVAPFVTSGIAIAPLSPANAGVLVPWSGVFSQRFEGHALKRISITVADETVRGEAVVTRHGLEGGAIYQLTPKLREALARSRGATILIDLKPDLDAGALASRLQNRRPKETVTNFLRKAARLDAVAIALLRESDNELPSNALALAARIKGVSLPVTGLSSIERAISTAGGVSWDELDDNLMLKRRAGIFVAGEMLDWEAPTGGYLLQATFATAHQAATGLLQWVSHRA
jgi:uncharacterized flavoprotein (TIGR03862 family)